MKCVNNSVSTHYTQYSYMSRKVTEHIPIHNIMQHSVNNTLNDLTHPVAVQEETTLHTTSTLQGHNNSSFSNHNSEA